MIVLTFDSNELKSLVENSIRKVLSEKNDKTTTSFQTTEYISLEDVSERYKIPKPTLYSYNCKKIIPFYKFGKKVFYKIKEIETYIHVSRHKTAREIESQAIDFMTKKGV